VWNEIHVRPKPIQTVAGRISWKVCAYCGTHRPAGQEAQLQVVFVVRTDESAIGLLNTVWPALRQVRLRGGTLHTGSRFGGDRADLLNLPVASANPATAHPAAPTPALCALPFTPTPR